MTDHVRPSPGTLRNTNTNTVSGFQTSSRCGCRERLTRQIHAQTPPETCLMLDREKRGTSGGGGGPSLSARDASERAPSQRGPQITGREGGLVAIRTWRVVAIAAFGRATRETKARVTGPTVEGVSVRPRSYASVRGSCWSSNLSRCEAPSPYRRGGGGTQGHSSWE